MTVLPWVDPAFSIMESLNPACGDDLVTFSVLDIENEGNLPVFEWYLNDELMGTDTSWSSTVNNGDKITSIMVSNARCINDTTINSDNSVIMVVNPNPIDTALIAKPFNAPYVLIYPAELVGDTTDYEYTWIMGSDTITSQTKKFYYTGEAIEQGIVYTLLVSRKSTKCATEITYNYTDDKSLLFTKSDIFVIYPNPAQTYFTISLNEEIIPEDFEPGTLKMVDITGKTVLTNEIHSIEQSIQFNNIDKGIYFIEILIPHTERQTKKIIIY
ncbi:MAG: hypothetical protein DRJ05_17770 [Bacteroidetes bacterium]|nr:MAG: hypothetical protein DRJ05_17770 [Bacteroidota bacterium]